ncbi:hypothetical protein A2W13_01165 [Candidatus Woesebacteria bacterium RBG_16_36_11]|uniref:Uncharacterized protein n=3 Tax=Candidatus Woeseibacteriota TaxID=1752722 RepID=A0A1F7XB45_9BACT|nr:MAG: hypothetical protein A2Z67_03170 [Candidatus Woesebacteria bacterium RBG_13_36_22]OGM12236.1 MAG: hypothetical protein A2W13_01165 [Candidatus Woesebacteria bacterium RBG_16_36_11]OGM16165.1 MAG: hypothetical protein A2V55_01355 [Candidatus Woesebacteria bacterium RBG_19FT_COMBO_37_29]
MEKIQLLAEDIGDPFEGIGPLGFEGLGDASNAGTLFEKFITATIGILTIVGILWFLISLILGAIGIIGSGGDKNALEAARKKITNAIVGLVVMIGAIFVVTLIGYLLGLDMNFILSPGRFVGNIWGP